MTDGLERRPGDANQAQVDRDMSALWSDARTGNVQSFDFHLRSARKYAGDNTLTYLGHSEEQITKLEIETLRKGIDVKADAAIDAIKMIMTGGRSRYALEHAVLEALNDAQMYAIRLGNLLNEDVKVTSQIGLSKTEMLEDFGLASGLKDEVDPRLFTSDVRPLPVPQPLCKRLAASGKEWALFGSKKLLKILPFGAKPGTRPIL